MPVEFNKPALIRDELDRVEATILSGQLQGGLDQPHVVQCQTFLEAYLKAKRVLLTTSCTDALELSALLADIGPGDRVVIPTYTFVSTANAFLLRGAIPVLTDVDSHCFNLTAETIRSVISPNIKAIVPVHYAGLMCDMDAIKMVAQEYGAILIEDAAQALSAKYHGKSPGQFSSMSAFSFHETKNITCGEGGALAINDETLIERAEVMLEKGTNRYQFICGKIPEYSWIDLGSSYLLSNVLASLLYAQLRHIEMIQAYRKRIWHTYQMELADWSDQFGVQQPVMPATNDHGYHIYPMLLPENAIRSDFISYMQKQGIQVKSHYVPLHLSKMGQRYGYAMGDFPTAERIAKTIVRLPLHNQLSNEDVHKVVKAVVSYRL